MSIPAIAAIQNQANTWTFTLSPNVTSFTGSEVLAATVSTGSTDTALISTTPTWTVGQTVYTKIDFALTSTETASLSPGFYVVQITLADNSAPLCFGLMEVVSAPGQLPTYDWLCTPAEVLGLVDDIAANVSNISDLPHCIDAASGVIRRYCCRWFTRKTWTKEFYPSNEGDVRLDELPVNQVLRVSTGDATAMIVKGDPNTFQLARVGSIFTGDRDSGQTQTGIQLTSTTNAVTTTTQLLFATYPTIQQLATAISSVSGWTTQVTNGFGAWPSSEIVGGEATKGALFGVGALIRIYSDEATYDRLDQDTGMIWISRESNTLIIGPEWGPDFLQWDYHKKYPRRVKITYDAGYTTIPRAVILSAIEVVQAIYARLKTDQIIKRETAGAYSYELKDEIQFIPDSARRALAGYRTHNA